MMEHLFPKKTKRAFVRTMTKKSFDFAQDEDDNAKGMLLDPSRRCRSE